MKINDPTIMSIKEELDGFVEDGFFTYRLLYNPGTYVEMFTIYNPNKIAYVSFNPHNNEVRIMCLSEYSDLIVILGEDLEQEGSKVYINVRKKLPWMFQTG